VGQGFSPALHAARLQNGQVGCGVAPGFGLIGGPAGRTISAENTPMDDALTTLIAPEQLASRL
jgi:hypothetical protein